MKVGKRSFRTILRRLAERENYVAAGRMISVHEHPLTVLRQEFFSSGRYPRTLVVRTPTGRRPIQLFHREDLSTLNLIFCRQDYAVPKTLGTVVDVGGNIGLSALFWLTRNTTSRVFLHEPVPRNVERLRANLSGFEDRYEVVQAAVSDRRGEVEFGIEDTGKLGGIGVATGQSIAVPCVHVMDVLEPVLDQHGVIDCLKIDVEGQEIPILDAIAPECWERIRCANIEHREAARHVPSYFTADRWGTATRLHNTRMGD